MHCLEPVKPRLELEKDFWEAVLQVWKKQLFVLLESSLSGLRSDIWGVWWSIFAPFNLHQNFIVAYQGNEEMFMLSPDLGFWILSSLSLCPLAKHGLVLVLSAAQSVRVPRCVWNLGTVNRLGRAVQTEAEGIQWLWDLIDFFDLCLIHLYYRGLKLGSQACWGICLIHAAWNN